ncbi:MAG: hypothetical protein COA32_10195 [Fluviicola sp.]|nr:MAG: hypothetical protein COA32_10195 [Fluviicola sp.]
MRTKLFILLFPMKSTLITLIFLITSSSICDAQSCNLPERLENRIETFCSLDSIEPEAYFKVSGDLFLYGYKNEELNLSKCKVYNYVDSKLFYSNDTLERLFAYQLIYVAGDTSYNEQLNERLNSVNPILNKSFIANILMQTNDRKYFSSIFDFLVSLKDGPIKNMYISNLSQEDHTAFKSICWENIDSDNIDRQIIAIRCLAQYNPDKKFQGKMTTKFSTWDDEHKKYLIQAMLFQKMVLKPYLIKYRNNPVIGHVVLKALKLSNHEEDNAYAKDLESDN